MVMTGDWFTIAIRTNFNEVLRRVRSQLFQSCFKASLKATNLEALGDQKEFSGQAPLFLFSSHSSPGQYCIFGGEKVMGANKNSHPFLKMGF